MMQRVCHFIKDSGERCRQAPLLGEEYCFWHHPDHAEEAAQARKLGGHRRRREKVTQGAYDLEGLDTVERIRRLLEIAVLDALGLENSVARSRVLIAASVAATKLLETAEILERVSALEATLGISEGVAVWRYRPDSGRDSADWQS